MSVSRLIVTAPGVSPRVFTLGKAVAAIGRATTNDIILQDSGASRMHSRLERTGQGVFISDLGSSNGTRINGVRLDRAALQPGDVISIGKTLLRFETHVDEDDAAMTRLETDDDLQTSLDQTPLEVELDETEAPRLTVHTPGRTWEVPLTGEVVTIGRDPDSTIVIDSAKVSRHHARLELRDGAALIRDLSSSNGTWLGAQAITEQPIRSGDTVRIGPALLTFKGGFGMDELTVVEDPAETARTRPPVVLIPGLGGSNLFQGNRHVWPNVRQLFADTDMFQLRDGAPVLEARGLVEEVVIIPNLIKMEQYGQLFEYLEENLGYQRGKDLMGFAYDWRQDVRQSARKLGEMIDGWNVNRPVTLICHSLGCLVGRYYVECLGGHKKVGRLMLLGGPHCGVPKAVSLLLTGPHILPLGYKDDKMRATIATFPSTYQILPTYSSVFDQAGQAIPVLEDDTWVDPVHRPLIHMAREFRKELGTTSKVATISIFGYGIKTMTRVNIERNAKGVPLKATPVMEPLGDGAIPQTSTVLDGTDIHPVRQNHGILHSDSDVKMRLKLELTRRRQ